MLNDFVLKCMHASQYFCSQFENIHVMNFS